MKRLAVGILLFTLVFAAVSCGNGSSPSGEVSKAVDTAKTVGQDTPAAASSLDPKTLINDEKIGRYILYQREILPVAGLAMGAGVDALRNSGGSQKGFEKELSRDERTQKIAAAQSSALSKSGLTQMEVTELTKLITPFATRLMMTDKEELKQKALEEMKSTYGPDASAALKKHLPELVKLQDEMLSKAMGAPK